MYAMSWERDVREYKYESIQTPYSVEYYEEEEPIEISLEEMLELQDEEMELEELEGEIYG
jgi:hypothetical protein